MQLEVSLDELEIIDSAMFAAGLSSTELGKRIEATMFEQKELADMEFDDCAGGACKL